MFYVPADLITEASVFALLGGCVERTLAEVTGEVLDDTTVARHHTARGNTHQLPVPTIHIAVWV